jgi:dihydrofolate synthase / folylpolyglutamate synthase
MSTFGLPKFGDGIGLHRIEAFFRQSGIDRDALARRSIVMTGSNGKGSTARFTAAALGAAGHRTGCFTSPHLFDVRERFTIGDTSIPLDRFNAYAKRVLAFNGARSDGDRIGAFEFLFLIAILWFEDEQPDAIVWEAGIGGRYDPVRMVKAKVSALTSIELEHTALLGVTEELIAYDKMDALARDGVLIVSPSVPRSLYDRIEAYARVGDKRAQFAKEHLAIRDVVNHAEGTQFVLSAPNRPGDRQTVSLHLIGAHQADNALTAFCAACAWRGVQPSPTAEAGMLQAISATTWPGRLEKVASAPDLWIDVGHTPVAVDVVTEAFLDLVPRERALVVFGVSASKEIGAIAATVASRFDHFILTRAYKAGAEIGTFSDAFTSRSTDVTLAPDTAIAAQIARERAQAEGLSVIALGGMFLAIEIQHAWTGGDPTDLDFF